MPTASEPRVMVRLAQADFDTLKALADRANISMGGLLRECGVRHGSAVARDVMEGSLKIRRQKPVAVRRQVQPGPVVLSEAERAREEFVRAMAARQSALNRAKYGGGA